MIGEDLRSCKDCSTAKTRMTSREAEGKAMIGECGERNAVKAQDLHNFCAVSRAWVSLPPDILSDKLRN